MSYDTLGYSSPDLQGHRCKLSLDPRPSKCGDNYTLHEARVQSEYGITDPKDRNIVMAKFPNKERPSRKWAERTICTCENARNMSKKFNTFLETSLEIGKSIYIENSQNYLLDGRQVKDGMVTFLKPQSHILDSVSSKDKKRKEGDWLVSEDKLKDFQLFIDRFGSPVNKKYSGVAKIRRKLLRKKSVDRDNNSNTSFEEEPPVFDQNNNPEPRLYPDLNALPSDDPPTYQASQEHALYGVPLPIPPSAPYLDLETTSNTSRQRSFSSSSNRQESEVTDDSQHQILHAFVHHAFCNSHGRRIFCNFKGSRDKEDGSYILSTPTVHSIEGQIGSRDPHDLGLRGMRMVIANHKCSRLCRHLIDMTKELDRVLAEQPGSRQRQAC